MVGVLGSGSNGPGLGPVQGTALSSRARQFTLIVPLSTQVYKWIGTGKFVGGWSRGGGGALLWTSIP